MEKWSTFIYHSNNSSDRAKFNQAKFRSYIIRVKLFSVNCTHDY